MIALDDWRRLQLDLPSRPEAIRRLIELGLKAVPMPPHAAGSVEAKGTDWPAVVEAMENTERKNKR